MKIKKILLGLTIIAGLTSCGGYTEKQGEAAESMCECMEKDVFGDYDINWYECDTELRASYNPEIFEEDSWVHALEEKCPEVASHLE